MDFSTTVADSINSEPQKDGWLPGSKIFRSAVNDDLLLIAGPRVLLPPHQVRRGCIAEKRFAKGMWRTFQGGRVLLTTVTPPEAIICAPRLIEDRYDESDYLVDRRALRL
jgi:hypothetical protein